MKTKYTWLLFLLWSLAAVAKIMLLLKQVYSGTGRVTGFQIFDAALVLAIAVIYFIIWRRQERNRKADFVSQSVFW